MMIICISLIIIIIIIIIISLFIYEEHLKRCEAQMYVCGQGHNAVNTK